MARAVTEILTAIDEFEPSGGNWLGLVSLLDELFQTGSAAVGIETLFRVFERYPNEDGAGVFWSIVHGLESLPGYETNLVESVRRAPTSFNLLMVNRLLNAGCEETGGIMFVSLLEHLVRNQSTPPKIRIKAQTFLARQEKSSVRSHHQPS